MVLRTILALGTILVLRAILALGTILVLRAIIALITITILITTPIHFMKRDIWRSLTTEDA